MIIYFSDYRPDQSGAVIASLTKKMHFENLRYKASYVDLQYRV